ncbi:hypothetical protein A2Z33_03080 [Candidatus Gottesmanbacteria bacterium RBG_16_52_11]|uniref:N(6)-L-threonylcarbamoyladenine synthase n=1 Tax=Candidatus Gottesmanbacteria bacterium RBG_16_52_11 TaxID=1798374 RepID=A0A1F5YV77_9BACT|nr:MAG: hypothetical protein A2Z33_03080 [Candidatus Gottesmanbacteria bacterium RBG_16_52_11]
MYANFIRDNAVADPEVIFPAVSLVTSGGHTELYLMKNPQTLTWLGGTLDDAAGEAFDKTARLLGFGGGGGGAIQAAAQRTGTRNIPKRAVLPRPLLRDDSLNFSFSGLKTAVMKNWGKTRHTEKNAEALAYEIQEAITDVLCTKTIRAALRYGAGSILVSGGVAANSRLRDKFTKACRGHFRLHVPPVRYCTDNAVTIAACAYFRNHPQPWKSVVARPDLSVEIAD